MIEFKNVYKTYPNGFTALKDVNLKIEQGEFVAIIGLSGAGKSTILRCINRMHDITKGSLTVDGVDVNSLRGAELRKYRRKVGMIFQSFNLVSRSTAIKNVLTADVPDMGFFKVLFGIFSKEQKMRALESLDKVGILDKAYTRCDQLSGGQQQRVAIARALVTEPAIICMDEPLSNLDAKLRVQLRNELKQMQKEFGITTIYVTHDQEEALTLSDRIAVFNKGYIEQIGTPNEVYNFSKTEFVCNFIGDINRLSGPVVRQMIDAGAELKETWHNYIRLERMHVNVEAQPGQTVVSGTVTRREYSGLYIKYYIDIGCQTVKVIEKNDGVRIYEEGQTVSVLIDPRDVMAYPAQETEVET